MDKISLHSLSSDNVSSEFELINSVNGSGINEAEDPNGIVVNIEVRLFFVLW